MQFTVLRKPLNGYDILILDILDSRLAGPHGLVVYKNRAGAAVTFTTPVFCPREPQVCPQDPQKHSIVIYGHFYGLSIECKLDFFDHDGLPDHLKTM
jgi:hypothetical protein